MSSGPCNSCSTPVDIDYPQVVCLNPAITFHNLGFLSSAAHLVRQGQWLNQQGHSAAVRKAGYVIGSLEASHQTEAVQRQPKAISTTRRQNIAASTSVRQHGMKQQGSRTASGTLRKSAAFMPPLARNTFTKKLDCSATHTQSTAPASSANVEPAKTCPPRCQGQWFEGAHNSMRVASTETDTSYMQCLAILSPVPVTLLYHLRPPTNTQALPPRVQRSRPYVTFARLTIVFSH